VALSEVRFTGPKVRIRGTPYILRFAPEGPRRKTLHEGLFMTDRVHVCEYRRVRHGAIERVRRHTRRFPLSA
jgi:hypothetical protein